MIDPAENGAGDPAEREQLEEERRRLQARAYGPDADIAGDPAAQARLVELDRTARALHDPFPRGAVDADRDTHLDASSDDAAALDDELGMPSGDRSAPSVPGPRDDGSDPDDTDGAPAGVSGDRASTQRNRGQRADRRRLVAAWSASLVLVALVVGIAASALTAAGSRPAGQPPDAQLVATLHRDGTFVPPRSYDSSSAKVSGFDEFHGLTAMAIRGWLGVANAPCLLLVQTDTLYSGPDFAGGGTSYGCSAGEFPATVSVRVDARLPDGVREMFAEGTGLQFVLLDDEIDVYADRAPTAEPTTTYSRVPRPSPTPLTIPKQVDGELSRAVVHPDDYGEPTVTAYTWASPKKGAEYSLEGECTSRERDVEMTYEVRTAGPTPSVIETGSTTCNGPIVGITGEIATDRPAQIVITGTDGVLDGYVVLVPAPSG